MWPERRLREEAGAQGGGCHGRAGREEEREVQVPNRVRRNEWARKALRILRLPGCEGGRGGMLMFSGHSRGREMAAVLGEQRVGLVEV